MDCILLATIPGTGTRYLQEFFLKMFPNNHMVNLDTFSNNPRLFEGIDGHGLKPHVTNIVAGHFYMNCMPMIKTLAQYWRPICTMRDPLAAIITRHESNKKETVPVDPIMMPFMFNAFIHLVMKMNPYIVPLDLVKTKSDKIKMLKDVSNVAKVSPSKEYIDSYVDKKPINTLGKYPLKKMYDMKDIEGLKKEIGLQIEVLKMLEPTFRPILEKVGYKDLMWWS